MAIQWTSYTTAQALLEILPGLGRLISVQMRETGEEEATMMQIGVLMHLREHPSTTSELAKLRKVSLQSASVLIQGLVEHGWVTRVPDPTDRRQSLLQVTSEGLARAQATQEQFTNLIAGVLDHLTPDEFDAGAIFLPALRRLVTERMMPDATPEK